MFKKPNNSGWTLCPSKSYPGNFYYFNIFNGEAAWCSDQHEKKVLRKQNTIQKLKANHLYPKPFTPPKHRSFRASNYHSRIRNSVPTFGQAIFSKYISNDKEIMGNIGTPTQILQQVTNTKIMLNQNTQTEEDIIIVYTHTIPLSKRFENKTNPNFGLINCLASTKPKDWWNSTNVWSDIGKHSDATDMQYKRKLAKKPILKESKLNKLQHTNKQDIYNKNVKQYSTQLNCNMVSKPKTMLDKRLIINLDANDLRYVLRAKRRKPVEMQDGYNTEHSTFNGTKTFNIIDNNNNTFHSEENYIRRGTVYTHNGNQQSSECYLVVDLDVLLEDYEFIKSYINKDKNCHLYVPSVIQDQLKIIAKEENNGRRCVILARQLLRHLGTVIPRLKLPENKEQTKIHQIIKCCLEIIKRNYDVVLITKEIVLIQTAKLYKIKVYHINDLKSNKLESNLFNITKTYKNKNVFLQNVVDFDPFSLSKVIRATDNYRQNISSNNNSEVNENNSDISDINKKIRKLNIDDKIFNIKRKVKNNLFENKMFKSNDNLNCNFKTLFHNISIDRTVQRNANEMKNITITFNTNNENQKNIIFENILKKFNITSSIMENNIYLRFEEWVCSYEQIIEEFLNIILQKNLQHVIQPPPWCLHEGMKCLKELYRDNNYIINIIEKFLYYYDFSFGNGTNIKPYNFMKIFLCGFYLVEALEKTSPFISDIQEKLIYMRHMLECPIEDSFSEVSICYDVEDRHTCKYSYVKSPSDVLDYLKKHYSEWKNYYEAYDNTNRIEQEVNKGNIRVFRTFGRDLNKLIINKSKCLNFTKETDRQTDKHEFQSNYLKVTRNITVLDTIKEKIKEYEKGLNCLDAAETIFSTSFHGNENKTINDRETYDHEIVSKNNDISDLIKDSGNGSNSLLSYSLVRIFLSELSSSLKIIHTFIDESVRDYSEDIDEDSKFNLFEKAYKTHADITEIIDNLKIIIQRESIDSTLKSLLIKAGTDDKRITRYRPVVMKCLEQAMILEKSLKLFISVTKDEVVSVVSSEENIQFLNIFE